MKMDDDIMVDYFQFLDKLNSDYRDLDRTALGYKQIGLTPIRNPESKWYVSKAEFSPREYPDFLSGWAWVTGSRAASRIVSASTKVPFFWIDDLWVTGILAAKSDVQIKSLNTFYTVYIEHIECCIRKSGGGASPEYLCDFFVGPSLEKLNLVRGFGKLALDCHLSQHCQRRKWQESVMKTCVKIDNPFFLPETPGLGEVIAISNTKLLTP